LGGEEIKTACLLCLPALLLTCFFAPACDGKELVAVNLRHSGGWEIKIDHDGGGSYGFGTTPARVAVTK